MAVTKKVTKKKAARRITTPNKITFRVRQLAGYTDREIVSASGGVVPNGGITFAGDPLSTSGSYYARCGCNEMYIHRIRGAKTSERLRTLANLLLYQANRVEEMERNRDLFEKAKRLSATKRAKIEAIITSK